MLDNIKLCLLSILMFKKIMGQTFFTKRICREFLSFFNHSTSFFSYLCHILNRRYLSSILRLIYIYMFSRRIQWKRIPGLLSDILYLHDVCGLPRSLCPFNPTITVFPTFLRLLPIKKIRY